MKAIIYGRSAYSLKEANTQIDTLRNHAKNNNIEIVGAYVVVGEGLCINNELEKILEKAKYHTFDMLLVTGVDRLGINISFVNTFVNDLLKYNVKTQSLNMP